MPTKAKSGRKPNAKKQSHARGSNPRWVKDVKTVSTFPPEHVFTKEPEEIARVMASKKVCPKGLGSAIRMVQYFINRGGKGLSATRREKLERAKRLLQARRDEESKSKKRKVTKRAKPR